EHDFEAACGTEVAKPNGHAGGLKDVRHAEGYRETGTSTFRHAVTHLLGGGNSMTIAHSTKWMRLALVLTGFFILAANPGWAQTTTGTVRGFVRDQNGTALAEAEVQARNPETGITRSATTNSEGAFVLPGLAPGTYDLTARHIGNSPQARRVVVQIGATLLTDFSLQAGAVEVAGVTVEATA